MRIKYVGFVEIFIRAEAIAFQMKEFLNINI